MKPIMKLTKREALQRQASMNLSSALDRFCIFSSRVRKSIAAAGLFILITLILISCSEEFLTPHEDLGADRLNDKTEADLTSQNTLVPYTYEALSNGTVKLSFQNLSGQTIQGDLIREGISYQQNGTILTEFSVLNGATHNFIDDNVVPNETYRYIFEYIIEGASEYTINFDTVTVRSTVPALGNFLLLPPYGGEAYDFLFDNQTIEIAGTNILVETDQTLTQSVVFILNGAVSKDNKAPFIAFPKFVASVSILYSDQ